VANYEFGDEIFLFGFSRGAFTARSISGMIRKCGILTRKHVDKYREALDLYHSDHRPDDPIATKFRQDHSLSPTDPIEIKFIGVWDTVGALGIPGGDTSKFAFHDTELSGSVRNAYHALAIDERRGPFQPTLWDYKPKPGQTIEQVWFAGVHSDIGGGYPEAGLSDIAMQWMMDKAHDAGLIMDPDARELHPNALQKPPHDSLTLKYKFLSKFDRPICLPSPQSKNDTPNGLDPTQSVHPSVLERWDRDESYRPANLRAYFHKIGDSRAKK
jgi:uncharacterized protein (DUF2235 family)